MIRRDLESTHHPATTRAAPNLVAKLRYEQWR